MNGVTTGSPPMNPPLITPPSVSMPRDGVAGLTTTVPVEVVLAADLAPVDLNNLFIGADDSADMVARSEREGFPRTCCSWTKGLYAAALRNDLQRVVGVVRGDCSNTEGLMEMLGREEVECTPFAYPYRPDREEMDREIRAFARRLDAQLEDAEMWRAKLEPVREQAAEIDRLTWQEHRVHGLENHLWLVSTSDFCGSPERYREKAEEFLSRASERSPLQPQVRLGYAGVPPIAPSLYGYLERQGALVAYNETQRQFAMPDAAEDLAEQYTRYTYPYGMEVRAEDIAEQCGRRDVDGLIHYVQSFCYRRMEDRLLRDRVDVPVLTVECARPGGLSGQLKTRLEAFVQMLAAREQGISLL